MAALSLGCNLRITIQGKQIAIQYFGPGHNYLRQGDKQCLYVFKSNKQQQQLKGGVKFLVTLFHRLSVKLQIMKYDIKVFKSLK